MCAAPYGIVAALETTPYGKTTSEPPVTDKPPAHHDGDSNERPEALPTYITHDDALEPFLTVVFRRAGNPESIAIFAKEGTAPTYTRLTP